MELPCAECLSGTDDIFLYNSGTNGCDSHPSTPMVLAAQAGHAQCLQTIISSHKDIFNDHKELAVALILAVIKGHLECTNILLKAKVKVNLLNTEYCVACEPFTDEHATCLEKVIEAGLDLDTGIVLNKAIERDHDKCVQILLAAGANVNAVCKLGYTPLMSAYRNTKYVDMLIKSGALVNVCTYKGTALSGAVEKCSDRSHLEKLIQLGIDVNAKDFQGLTALVKALENSHYDAIHLLLNAGADVNIKDKSGLTVLQRVTPRTRKLGEIVQQLLQAGADVNVKDENGNTPLNVVVLYPNPYNERAFRMPTYNHHPVYNHMLHMTTSVKLLLQANSPINMYNHKELNALQSHLIEYGPLVDEICLLLLAAGESLGNLIPEDFPAVTTKIRELYQYQESSRHLKSMCRQLIRNHLMKIDQHKNLIVRIPKLGLPVVISSFLLYDVSVDLPELDLLKDTTW